MGWLARGALLAAALLVAPTASAQTIPLDDPVEDVVNNVGNTVNNVGNTVDDVVDNVGGTVGQTTQGVQEAVGSATGGGGGGGGGSSNPVDQVGSAVGSVTGGGGGSGNVTTATGGGSGSARTKLVEQRGDRTRQGRAKSEPAGGPQPALVMGRLVVRTQNPSFSAVSYVPLAVQLTNDADRDGRYGDSEAASAPNEDVSFQVRVENIGSSELTILAIRDASPTPMGSTQDPRCGDLVGISLAPGQSRTCRFTAGGFSPPPGERFVTVFEVDVADPADPSRGGTVTDTTLVATENGVLGLFVKALAGTGARIAMLLLAAALLVGVGLLFRRLGRRRSGRETLPVERPSGLGHRVVREPSGGGHPPVTRPRPRTRRVRPHPGRPRTTFRA
jgi:hypothetical protein